MKLKRADKESSKGGWFYDKKQLTKIQDMFRKRFNDVIYLAMIDNLFRLVSEKNIIIPRIEDDTKK